MIFTLDIHPKDGSYELKTGPRRIHDGKLALVWVVSKKGGLKPALRLSDGGLTAIVKVVEGDTIFMIRDQNCGKDLTAYFIEGQNVRRVNKKTGFVSGPEIGQWVSSDFISPNLQDGINLWCERKRSIGKCFVQYDPNLKPVEGEKSTLVYSTEDGPNEEEVHSDTRVAIFGKKRRAV